MLSHTRQKHSLDSQSAFCTHSAVYILYLVYILYPVCSLQFVLTGIRGTNTVYFWLQLFAQHIQSTPNTYAWVNSTFLFFSTLINTLLSFCKNVDIIYKVSSNPPTRPNNNSYMHSMPIFCYIRAYYTFGLLDCVCYNKDFVTWRFFPYIFL